MWEEEARDNYQWDPGPPHHHDPRMEWKEDERWSGERRPSQGMSGQEVKRRATPAMAQAWRWAALESPAGSDRTRGRTTCPAGGMSIRPPRATAVHRWPPSPFWPPSLPGTPAPEPATARQPPEVWAANRGGIPPAPSPLAFVPLDITYYRRRPAFVALDLTYYYAEDVLASRTPHPSCVLVGPPGGRRRPLQKAGHPRGFQR